MRRFIYLSLFFIPVCVICYILLLSLWGVLLPKSLTKNLHFEFETENMYSRLRDANAAKEVEVLFLGSSHCYRGIDPRIFSASNISSFNLGSSAQTPIQTKFLLKSYLQKFSPELVVFEVYPLTFFSNGIESALDVVSNGDLGMNTIQMAVEINDMRVYNTAMFSATNKLTSGLFTNYETSVKDDYIEGTGYVERIKSPTPTFVHSPDTLRWNINEKQLDHFRDCTQMLKDRGIKYFLVQAPVTSQLYKKYLNNSEIDSIYSALGHYYNFNGKVSLSDSLHFYDDNHLNQQGVKRFNDYLLPIVKTYLQEENVIVEK